MVSDSTAPNDTLRVAQVLAGQGVGGAEYMYARTTAALGARDELTQQAWLRPHERWLGLLSDAGVPTETARFGGKLDLLTRPKLNRAARAFDPDVVLCWMSRAAHFGPVGRWTLAARLGGYYPMKYYRNCTAFIGISKGLCDYLVREGAPADRVFHIPNWASESPVKRTLMRAELGLPDSAPILLAAGRLHVNKAFDTLLRALKDVPDAHLLIAGEGPEREALLGLAEELGVGERLRLLGWVDNVPDYLELADVFVCSSRIEPLGSIVPEAWAYDCPMVAARADGPAEMITHEHDGLLCDIDAVAEMAAHINTLLNDSSLAKSLSAAGRQTYEATYHRDIILGQFIDFFRAVKPS